MENACKERVVREGEGEQTVGDVEGLWVCCVAGTRCGRLSNDELQCGAYHLFE